MYSFQQKRAIARRIADPGHIEIYRVLLRGYDLASSTMKMTDKQQLAESLVFRLLEYYSEEALTTIALTQQQLKKIASGQPVVTPVEFPADSEVSAQPAEKVKKNSQSSRNTRTSDGQNSKTISSEQPTASTPTESTSGTGFANWKDRLKALLK